MFKVIREVNGDSNANDLSIVKEIDHLAFGREAQGGKGELTPPDPRLIAGTEIDAESMDPTRREEQERGAANEPGLMDDRGAAGGMGKGYNTAAIGFPPFHRRYVDLNYKPLPSDKVLEVIRAKTLGDVPEEQMELVIAKRVPFRIAVKMDERKIAEFMAACANSPFAFEINQVRINRHDPNGEEIPIGGFDESGDKLSRMGTSIGDQSSNVEEVTKPVEVRTNYDVNVEFYGIVKIYNPVREDLLRQAIGLEPETPAEQPACQRCSW